MAEEKDDLQKKVEEAAQQAEEEKQTAAQEDGDDLEQQVNDLKNQLARALADLQNYKRRTEEEKARFVKFANAELLSAILPVVDNLNRSAQHMPDDLKDNEWCKGVMSIHQDMIKTMASLGIEKIPTVGEKLDPNKHDAVMQGPGEQDVIIEEFEPGYTLNGDVVKPAKVKVGNGEKPDKK